MQPGPLQSSDRLNPCDRTARAKSDQSMDSCGIQCFKREPHRFQGRPRAAPAKRSKPRDVELDHRNITPPASILSAVLVLHLRRIEAYDLTGELGNILTVIVSSVATLKTAKLSLAWPCAHNTADTASETWI